MNKRLFVAGLPFSTTDEELNNLFQGAGNVASAVVIKDRDTGRSKGFGFVEMETEEEAGSAISKFNDSEYGGRKLIVSEARPKEDRSRDDHRGGFRQGAGGFRGQRKSFGKRREGGRGNFGRDGRGGGRRGFSGKH